MVASSRVTLMALLATSPVHYLNRERVDKGFGVFSERLDVQRSAMTVTRVEATIVIIIIYESFHSLPLERRLRSGPHNSKTPC